MALAYRIGSRDGYGLLLTAIIWKESSFGVKLINRKDGKNGSYGVAQILLETAMVRNNVKTSKEVRDLRMKLLTDHIFNLNEAVKELKFWRQYHKVRKKRKQWRLYTVASYNAGFRSYKSPKGRAYANDIAVRIEALKKFFKRDKFKINRFIDLELDAIAKSVHGR